MTRSIAGLMLLVLTACNGGGSSSPPVLVQPQATPAAEAPVGSPWFVDRAPASGVSFTHRNGEEADHYTILESLGGGVAVFDFDLDGKEDLFFPGGGFFEGAPPAIRGHPCRLYRNLGDWKFEDVTQRVLPSPPTFYSHGCTVGDYNRDGWPDLLVTGYRGIALYENRPATDQPAVGRILVDVTAQVGLPRELPWSTSAAFADLDGDGSVDLMIAQYLDWSWDKHQTCPHHQIPKDVCSPHQFNALRPRLFYQRGGRFVDGDPEAKLDARGKGLGLLIADLNQDGRPDVYLANDASDNHLYLNRNGKLVECGRDAGVALDESGHYNGSMGIAVGDWNRSGRPSLFVTNFQDEYHALYTNLDGERFAYQTQAAGVSRIGQKWVGFGTAMVDLDGDGWLDLPIVNGHVFRHPVGSTLAQKPLLLHNTPGPGGRRLFQDRGAEAGEFFRGEHRGRGLAVADLDNDGWPDLVVSHLNEPVTLLRNACAGGVGQSHHRLSLRLAGRGHRSAVGARVEVVAGGSSQVTFQAAGGYLCHPTDRLLIGLGTVPQADRIIVHWPWGKSQEYPGPFPPGRLHTLREGE